MPANGYGTTPEDIELRLHGHYGTIEARDGGNGARITVENMVGIAQMTFGKCMDVGRWRSAKGEGGKPNER